MKAIFLPRTFLCVNLLPSPSKFLQISIPFRHLFATLFLSLLAGNHFSTFFIPRASRTVRRWHRVDIHCFLCASCIHRVWNWRYHRARVIRYGITRFRERKCDCLLKSHQHPQSPPTVPPTSQSFDRKLCVYVWLYCIQIANRRDVVCAWNFTIQRLNSRFFDASFMIPILNPPIKNPSSISSH